MGVLDAVDTIVNELRALESGGDHVGRRRVLGELGVTYLLPRAEGVLLKNDIKRRERMGRTTRRGPSIESRRETKTGRELESWWRMSRKHEEFHIRRHVYDLSGRRGR